jgi:pimeloyl-ACP methyl ester carboxylesterase
VNIVIDGLMTNYQLSGKGKLVLLLHGWGDSSKGLQDLAKELSKKYQVLALDLPGFGATQAPKTVWNLDDYGLFVKSFIKKMGLKEPYAIIGHSNGGALAIRSLAQGVLKADRLVLMAPSGIRDRGSAKRVFLKIIAKTGNVATIWMPARYRMALRKSLYGVAGSDIMVAPHLDETFKKTVRQDVQSDARMLDLPTLLIFARNDRAVPIADGYKYRDLIRGSQLEIIEDASHFLHLDKADQVTGLIERFLA